MKKIYTILAMSLISLLGYSQSSLTRIVSNTKFGWVNKTVPVNAYVDSTFKSLWSLVGNAPSNNNAHLGTTNAISFDLRTSNLSRMKVDSSGNISIYKPMTLGSTGTFGGYGLYNNLPITGAATSNNYISGGEIKSDVVNAHLYRSELYTQASPFVLTNAIHFFATQSSIGAGSSITNQVGFFVNSTMSGATNNRAFQGVIGAGANNWNLYMNGAAQNHLAGNLGVGAAITVPTAKVHLGAGTAAASTAPLKFTAGTNNTTGETGAMEYNGTNLFFVRTGTARENVITSVQVNVVSPTAPDRTIQVVIDGVTYYIAAKTTNN